jgi:formylmethanofuran dehydrogenase subunit A
VPFSFVYNAGIIRTTGTPAKIMGQDHRIGRLIEGSDAGVQYMFPIFLPFSF